MDPIWSAPSLTLTILRITLDNTEERVLLFVQAALIG